MTRTPETPEPSHSGAAAVRPNIRLIALLSLGHTIVDITQGGLPTLLPLLKSTHHLSYMAVSAMVLVTNLTSSVIQPAFGYFSDRQSRRWILPVSLLLTAIGMSLVGVAPSYEIILGLLVLMGMGVASFHPEAYRTAGSVAGSKRATAISWFSVGGNAGNAMGPPAMALLIGYFGLAGSLGMIVPGTIMAGIFILILPALSRSDGRIEVKTSKSVGHGTMPGAMTLLIVIVALRSWIQIGFTTFLPFYYVDYLKADSHSVGLPLFVFLGAGALGTIIGGPLADRWGMRNFMLSAYFAATPVAVLFLLTRGFLSLIFLGLFGGLLIATFTISVVLGQSYLPRNAGLASGLIVGFAIGAGGVAVTLLGWIADHYGVVAVLWIGALTPLACLAATLFLPVPKDG
jgi:FSR family fosmidomycin resistance protein-like MFS transporter